MKIIPLFCGFMLFTASMSAQTAPGKPLISLDEAFNYVGISDVQVAPNANAAVIETRRADWEASKFREELWIWKEGTLAQLTRSGHDGHAVWSPDGKWIAFFSDRAIADEKPASDEEKDQKNKGQQIYLISTSGGEAFPVTHDHDGVHAFAWAPDSSAIFYSIREPWSKKQRDDYEEKWKDVQQYREADRGDVISRVTVAQAITNADLMSQLESAAKPASSAEKSAQDKEAEKKKKEEEVTETPGSVRVGSSRYAISEIAVSPDGASVAFMTAPPSSRVENTEEFEIYLLPSAGGNARQITRNNGVEDGLRWTKEGTILFVNSMGSVEGPYEDVQPRIYSLDPKDGRVIRWAKAFGGAFGRPIPAEPGAALSTGTLGTEQPIVSASRTSDQAKTISRWPGTYSHVSRGESSGKIAFVYSSQEKPEEVYLADSAGSLPQAKAITSFNKLFTQRELPKGEPYRWKSDDGQQIEGWLIYPPGKFHAKGLRMLTLIHGGPEGADGNAFSLDWYDWANLAASRGWLVFRPNYRGSTGYGDKFEVEIAPHLVSKPGRDILTGVDALVKDGIADGQHLAVGGYSYGGYMTNWLLTQTTRFRSAVTGAGAVEHAVNWGNDDLTFDDAWFLGGNPWQAEQNYNEEAAIWQLNKVKTPTHIVGGSDDIRVYVGEQYLLERALHALKVPSTLLIFPGEGHPLAMNPWHGKIKVREELQWIERFDK